MNELLIYLKKQLSEFREQLASFEPPLEIRVWTGPKEITAEAKARLRAQIVKHEQIIAENE